MLEEGRPADDKTVKHIDRCLSCLACMTTCPSGVHYMHLVDHARAYIEETYEPAPGTTGRCAGSWRRCCPTPGAVPAGAAGGEAGASRSEGSWCPTRGCARCWRWRRRSIPPVSRNDDAAGLRGPGRPTDARGADDGLRAEGAEHRHQRRHDPPADAAGGGGGRARGRGLLRGADASHGQDGQRPRLRRRATSRPGTREMDGDGLDAIVINTSGLRYDGEGLRPHVPRPIRRLAEDAAAVSAIARDVSPRC